MKTINCIVAAALVALAGCKDKPTVEDMEKLGEASGYTTAYVLNNQVKVDDATRAGICSVVVEVAKYVPAAGATYTETWVPAAQALIDKAVAEGKIAKAVADKIMVAVGYVTGLLDAYIEKKGVAEDKDLVNAFVRSFVDSFLANFAPTSYSAAEQRPLDPDTLEILNKLIK